MNFKLQIDNQPFQYEIEGEFSYGADEVLIEQDKNAIEFVSWKKEGYTLFDLFSTEEFKALQNNLIDVLNEILKDEGLGSLDHLKNYHKVVDTPKTHQQVISRTRLLTKKHFKIDLDAICERISKMLGKEVGIYNPRLEEEIITLRISRPNSLDINPLHRDGYLDFYKDTINLWIPIVGCNEKSSLPVIPGSHCWNESEVLRTERRGASIQGLVYNVPGIVKGPEELKAIRPNPQYRQALVFSPYLVHGSAINMNTDVTRMALELRPCLQ